LTGWLVGCIIKLPPKINLKEMLKMKHYTETELKAYADQVSNSIVIRTYENGHSNDERRITTRPEKQIIFSVVYGALLSINNGANIQSAKDCAEFIGDQLIPSMNGYDTIYCPIASFPFNN
jgi:hypothetical protein